MCPPERICGHRTGRQALCYILLQTVEDESLRELRPTCWLVGVGSSFCAMQHQSPLLENGGFDVGLDANDGLHDNIQSPGTPRQLSPSVGGHKWPARKPIFVIVVIWSLAQYHGTAETHFMHETGG